MVEDIWGCVLRKSDAEREILLQNNPDKSELEDMEFVYKMIASSMRSANGVVSLNGYEVATPESLSFFLNRYFFFEYKRKYEQYLVNTCQRSEFTWYYDEQQLLESDAINYFRMWGPRWNVFAKIANLIIDVESEIEVDFSTVIPYSDAYNFVIYEGNQQKTVASFGSRDGELRRALSLPKGRYQIFYRYYGDDNNLFCPAVKVDNTRMVEATCIQSKKRFALAEFIQSKRSPVYFWQQYYVFQLLKRNAPEFSEVIKHEFTPVPNPDTHFQYGWMSQGQAIKLICPETTISNFRIYLMYLNEQSLPTYWIQVTQEVFFGENTLEDGAYCLRFVPRGKPEKSQKEPIFDITLI